MDIAGALHATGVQGVRLYVGSDRAATTTASFDGTTLDEPSTRVEIGLQSRARSR